MRGALLIVGAAPALAKGTTGIELVAGAERASTVKPEALEPGACGETGHGHETPPQGDAGHEVERLLQEVEQELDALPRKGEHGVNASPQGSPKEGKHESGHEALRQSEHEVPPQRDPNEGALATWNPGGK